MEVNTCHYCGELRELRPYGPGGASVCFPCINADPVRHQEAVMAFQTLLSAATAMADVAVLTPQGPQPVTRGELIEMTKTGDLNETQ